MSANQSRQQPNAIGARTLHLLRSPLGVAVAVALVLPLTAFAGIGAWNGMQRVVLASAVEMSAPISASVPAEQTAPAEETSTRGPQSDDSRPGFLGVSTAGMTNQLRERFGVPADLGVLVSEINEDSAAYQAGLEAGDVITSVDGTSIENGSDLRRAIRRAGADSNVRIEIYRDGRIQELDATLGTARRTSRSFTWTGDDNQEWGDNDWSEEDINRFTERMEDFGERMSELGERFGERFGDDWAQRFEQNGEEFGRRMEAWGEDFGRRMEERFENGDWDEEEFERSMEELQLNLEDMDFEGIGAMVQQALEGIDWNSISQDISDAVEEALSAIDDGGDGGGNRE